MGSISKMRPDSWTGNAPETLWNIRPDIWIEKSNTHCASLGHKELFQENALFLLSWVQRVRTCFLLSPTYENVRREKFGGKDLATAAIIGEVVQLHVLHELRALKSASHWKSSFEASCYLDSQVALVRRNPSRREHLSTKLVEKCPDTKNISPKRVVL